MPPYYDTNEGDSSDDFNASNEEDATMMTPDHTALYYYPNKKSHLNSSVSPLAMNYSLGKVNKSDSLIYEAAQFPSFSVNHVNSSVQRHSVDCSVASSVDNILGIPIHQNRQLERSSHGHVDRIKVNSQTGSTELLLYQRQQDGTNTALVASNIEMFKSCESDDSENDNGMWIDLRNTEENEADR